MTDILNTMLVKRILVVADANYSGTMSRSVIAHIDASEPVENRITYFRALAKSRARMALTSGGLNPVADAGKGNLSVFAGAFVDVLKNNNDIIAGQTLYREIQARMAASPTATDVGLTPTYSPIRHAGHESGEFFLIPISDS